MKAKGPDYLYINFDLNPQQEDGKPQTFSLIYLIQTGVNVQSGNSNMQVEGFLDIVFKKDVWMFFAISCNYQSGEFQIYIKMFGEENVFQQREVNINFPEFNMNKFGELVFAGVENNPYFQSTSGFIGNVGYVEMGRFFTKQLAILWMGYLDKAAYLYRGILLEFLFEGISENSQSISSTGAINSSF